MIVCVGTRDKGTRTHNASISVRASNQSASCGAVPPSLQVFFFLRTNGRTFSDKFRPLNALFNLVFVAQASVGHEGFV